jgi:hypothetical protein
LRAINANFVNVTGIRHRNMRNTLEYHAPLAGTIGALCARCFARTTATATLDDLCQRSQRLIDVFGSRKDSRNVWIYSDYKGSFFVT